jgi:glutathione S-transferase
MHDSTRITVYGSSISYFSGKLEGYLRYKEIPYQLQPMTGDYFNKIIPEKTGAQQMPAAELADGRWMTDTTPMIAWFEEQYPQYPIVPADPVQAYICQLIEDYADEWLWRPAMHYRWSYPHGRQLLSTVIVDELFADIPAPTAIKRWKIRRRQKTNFVDKDGVNAATRDHVERAYLGLLDILEPVFQQRAFLFGERPTLADIGLFGPMFRHFSQDPEPAAIMREKAPAVNEWVARMWNARGARLSGSLEQGIPADLLPLLTEIGQSHLPNLAANARAWKAGHKHYDISLQSTHYRDIPTSRYRGWCLEELQARFNALDTAAREQVTQLLKQQECWNPLWEVADPRSEYNIDRKAPFAKGLKVYDVHGA